MTTGFASVAAAVETDTIPRQRRLTWEVRRAPDVTALAAAAHSTAAEITRRLQHGGPNRTA